MGARTPSPVTTLEEVLVAVRRPLVGERVTMHGRHVNLDEVELDQPPREPPPLRGALCQVLPSEGWTCSGAMWAGSNALDRPCTHEVGRR